MASYTTPRTANIGDIFTAAWYNAELRDDIKWAHDTLISADSSFPASPLTGQRHLFVSGNTRLMFVYDGSHWLSDTLSDNGFNAGAFVDQETVTTSPAAWGVAFGSNFWPIYNVKDALAAGCTAQARVDVMTLDNDVGLTLRSGLYAKLIAAADTSIGAASHFSGGDPAFANTFQEGAWTDIATGAYVAVQPIIYRWRTTGSADGFLSYGRTYVRFKK